MELVGLTRGSGWLYFNPLVLLTLTLLPLVLSLFPVACIPLYYPHPTPHPPSIYYIGVAEQIADLKRGAEIVVCTPGRMIDILCMQAGKMTTLRYMDTWIDG